MTAKCVEDGGVTMDCEGGPRRAVLLQINFVAFQGEEAIRLSLQDVDLFLREIIGQKQPALVLQLFQLSIIQFHAGPFFDPQILTLSAPPGDSARLLYSNQLNIKDQRRAAWHHAGTGSGYVAQRAA